MPVWEDAANANGGRVAFRMNIAYANYFWENLLFAMIGDQFPPEIEVSGVLYSATQKKQQIQIWVGKKEPEHVNNFILKLREVL